MVGGLIIAAVIAFLLARLFLAHRRYRREIERRIEQIVCGDVVNVPKGG